MGNNFEPEQFKQTAPVELAQASFNKDSMMLDMKINPGIGFSNWKWNLAPFQSKNKHLFLPNRFIDPELQPHYSKSSGCKQKGLFREQIILAQYQPYIFTLQNEILTRKSRKLNFKQHQLWKILKNVTLAFRDWYHAYPDLPIGPVTPSQILFNTEGHIKLMNRFSFISQNPLKTSQYYPELKNYENALSQSIYNLGICLIDTVTLSQSRVSNMSLQQKKFILSKYNIYPQQIKRTILAMIQPDPKIRIKLQEIINSIKYYKRISQSKQQLSQQTNTFCIG